RHLASAADLGDAAALDDECRILDRRAAVAGDEPCSFKQRGAGRRLSRCWRRPDRSDEQGCKQNERPCCQVAHRASPREKARWRAAKLTPSVSAVNLSAASLPGRTRQSIFMS